tara:strand:- start:46 stop:1263 length:1218 start_codon:yes stop_codon:yes gene_type:complete
MIEIFIDKLWSFVLEISPYLIMGFFFSGILSVVLSVETVTKYLGKNKSSSVFLASLFGIPLPLCSCGVIPVFSYLKKHGASKSATTSFLISTPQTGVDSIMITYSLLGPIFAIYRPVVAFVSGLIGGTLVSALDKDKELNENEIICDEDCCDEKDGVIYRIIDYGFVKLPQDIGSVLVAGILAAAFIAVIIPENYFMNIGSGILGMIIMLLLGLPSYVCATASVPIALALHLKGFSMGSLMVFLMSGPATNIATISVALKQLGRKSTLIYISSIVVCSIISGLLFDLMFPGLKLEEALSSMAMLPHSVEIISAVLLIIILANVFRLNYFVSQEKMIKEQENISKLSVKGMTCNHCVDVLTKTLNKIKGVSVKNIDLKSGQVSFANNEGNDDAIHKKINDLGYTIE